MKMSLLPMTELGAKQPVWLYNHVNNKRLIPCGANLEGRGNFATLVSTRILALSESVSPPVDSLTVIIPL